MCEFRANVRLIRFNFNRQIVESNLICVAMRFDRISIARQNFICRLMLRDGELSRGSTALQHDTHLYAPAGTCTRNSHTTDCMRRLRCGRSYSLHYSRCGPARTGRYRHRGSRSGKRTCICRRRPTRTARSHGIPMDSSNNRSARIDRPPGCTWACRCTRSASCSGARCTARFSCSRNRRCTRLECETVTRDCESVRLESIFVYNAIKDRETAREERTCGSDIT